MKIEYKLNGKSIEPIKKAETEIHMDLGSGKDCSAEVKYTCNQGQATIISQHINPHLKCV